MRGLGFLLVIVGIVATVAALMMDTSVVNSAGTVVSDVRLMADRQVYMLLGGLVLVAGVLIALFVGRNK